MQILALKIKIGRSHIFQFRTLIWLFDLHPEFHCTDQKNFFLKNQTFFVIYLLS